MKLTTAHWGTYRVETVAGRVVDLHAFEADADPSPIGRGVLGTLDGPLRIARPSVRRGWLDNGPGSTGSSRGSDSFVEVSWETANTLVAEELRRVIGEHGNRGIYAGSYGWGSAGRFHHPQGQLKRFLNCIGGFTGSRNSYSFAAAEVVVPHVLGDFWEFLENATSWDVIAQSCTLFVAFGGVPLKNGQVSSGGVGAHVQRAGVLQAARAGTRFVNVSPLRDDIDAQADPEWLALRPSTDTALILGLAHTLLTEGLHDRAFLDRYTVGFDQFAAYLRGDTDGQAKSADWAARITGIDVTAIRDLARRMATQRTMISMAYSLTRQDHGEQPWWAAIALAAMLGQIGLPGGGFGFGYSAMNNIGLNRVQIPYASFPQGQNPVSDFIPVARITDMLTQPGATVDYNGETLTYPDIRLIWWAGGNPFHHHQDLNRLVRAWTKPETIIVNEWCWNSVARHADIVLPVTTPLERDDIALSPKDPFITVMERAVEPFGQARDDHEILRGVAAELGVEQAFTEGRSPEQWRRWLYEESVRRAAAEGTVLPSWQELLSAGSYQVPAPDKPRILLQDFRADPLAHPLKTPSGRIELFSETIAAFGYDDCAGHPTWFEPLEWLGNAAAQTPLHMISNQPKTKLHSQLDQGSVSRADRIDGREPVLIHPEDAARRGLRDGQIVRISNSRGALLAGLRVSDGIRPGVIQIATGAWWDPDGPLCRHGNPNAVTPDNGTSRLAQGPIAHTCLVDVEAWNGALPPVGIDTPPVARDTGTV